jgi:hypothetical protein
MLRQYLELGNDQYWLGQDDGRPHDTVTVPDVAYAVNFIDLLMIDTERVRNMLRLTKQEIKYCDVTSCWYFLMNDQFVYAALQFKIQEKKIDHN